MKMSKLRLFGAFSAFVGLVFSFSVAKLHAQNRGETYALTNAKIVTVSGGSIDKGTIVIRDGLIESVGASVNVPADAKKIDATGLTIYPGFFDANSNDGITASAPAQQQGPQRGGGQGAPPTTTSNSAYPTGLQPETSAVDLIKAGDSSFESARNNGFTTVLSVPRERIFNGQSALVNTAGSTVSQMLLRSPVALHVSFNTLGGSFPVSLLGTFAQLRQMFLDAQRLQAWQKIYAANPRGVKRPDADKSLDVLISALNREIPVGFNVNSEREIIRALDFSKEFNLKPIIVGGGEAWKVASRLKAADATVLLSMNLPKRTTAASPDADPEELDVLRARANAPKCAAALKAAGVKFAFQSGGMTNLGDFVSNANKIIDNGLSKDDTLRAMTLGAAEIFGVSDRLGSIETGKIANLVVVRGDVFAKDKAITHVFVDGVMFEQKAPPKEEKKPDAKPGTAAAASNLPNLTGTWALTIEVPGNTLTGTMNLTQKDDGLTGNIATQLGTNEIRNGKVTATGVTFDQSVTFGGQTFDISYSGKINGNEITGSIETPQGAIPFSATKNP